MTQKYEEDKKKSAEAEALKKEQVRKYLNVWLQFDNSVELFYKTR